MRRSQSERTSILRPRISVTKIVLLAIAILLFVVPGVAPAADPQNPQVAILQALLQKYRGCILERYETKQDMVNRGLSAGLSGLSNTNGLQDRDVVTCVAGNQCSRAQRLAIFNKLQAQASLGDATNFEGNLRAAIPADCFQCQKHQEWHTKHVHCTMDCGGNNGFTQGPCFEGCKAGVDITRSLNDLGNDIHRVLQKLGSGNQQSQVSGGTSAASNKLPFDLVWDPGTGVDANSLPLNPHWRYQVDHPGLLPDFQQICAGAIPGQRSLAAAFSQVCTTQAPTID